MLIVSQINSSISTRLFVYNIKYVINIYKICNLHRTYNLIFAMNE